MLICSLLHFQKKIFTTSSHFWVAKSALKSCRVIVSKKVIFPCWKIVIRIGNSPSLWLQVITKLISLCTGNTAHMLQNPWQASYPRPKNYHSKHLGFWLWKKCQEKSHTFLSCRFHLFDGVWTKWWIGKKSVFSHPFYSWVFLWVKNCYLIIRTFFWKPGKSAI